MRQPHALRKRRVAIALWFTVLALPLLVIDNIERADAFEPAAASPPPAALLPIVTAPAVTAPAVNATDATPASTTAEPPTPPTATTTESAPAEPEPAAPANEQTGGASWYRYRSGECAHRTIPKGTTVTITNRATGATTTCVVTDRGPFSGGRVIDLDDGTFAQIASTSRGVVQVRITW